LHGEVEVRAGEHAVVDRGQPLVVELEERSELATEALADHGGAVGLLLDAHLLDRDDAVEVAVARPVDLAEAPRAERLEAVEAGEEAREVLLGLRVRRSVLHCSAYREEAAVQEASG